MGQEDTRSARGEEPGPEHQERQAGGDVGAQVTSVGAEDSRWLSPLYQAHHAPRYDRQDIIREYEREHRCRLVVMIDVIYSDSVPFFEELLFDANPSEDLHVMLASPGGDGETAVRLVRMAQQRCRHLTVIVPDQAKSAATIFALGAHHILMGPTSDLGPVDPQLHIAGVWVSAKDLIEAVDRAQQAVSAAPDSYPLHVALLADVNAIIVQQARSALLRTGDLVEEALRSNPDRTDGHTDELKSKLSGPFIERPRSHAAIIGHAAALEAGLPALACEPNSTQWRQIWTLWSRYLSIGPLGAFRIYEGARASQVIPWGP